MLAFGSPKKAWGKLYKKYPLVKTIFEQYILVKNNL